MIYQISSCQGPSECEMAVRKLLEYMQANYDVSVIDTSAGYNSGDYRSVRFYSPNDLTAYVGSVQWICKSLYRPNHKRKNWFIDFSVCEVVISEEFDEEQIVFDTFRSGGKGGQNVNKVETGVRAIYIPTGTAVICTSERSQHANKQTAIKLLKTEFEKLQRDMQDKTKNEWWQRHNAFVRGGAKTVFVGERFEKKN